MGGSLAASEAESRVVPALDERAEKATSKDLKRDTEPDCLPLLNIHAASRSGSLESSDGY
jgi:hypothetical protein